MIHFPLSGKKRVFWFFSFSLILFAFGCSRKSPQKEGKPFPYEVGVYRTAFRILPDGNIERITTPVQGVTVTVLFPGGEISRLTDARGKVSFPERVTLGDPISVWAYRNPTEGVVVVGEVEEIPYPEKELFPILPPEEGKVSFLLGKVTGWTKYTPSGTENRAKIYTRSYEGRSLPPSAGRGKDVARLSTGAGEFVVVCTTPEVYEETVFTVTGGFVDPTPQEGKGGRGGRIVFPQEGSAYITVDLSPDKYQVVLYSMVSGNAGEGDSLILTAEDLSGTPLTTGVPSTPATISLPPARYPFPETFFSFSLPVSVPENKRVRFKVERIGTSPVTFSVDRLEVSPELFCKNELLPYTEPDDLRITLPAGINEVGIVERIHDENGKVIEGGKLFYMPALSTPEGGMVLWGEFPLSISPDSSFCPTPPYPDGKMIIHFVGLPRDFLLSRFQGKINLTYGLKSPGGLLLPILEEEVLERDRVGSLGVTHQIFPFPYPHPLTGSLAGFTYFLSATAVKIDPISPGIPYAVEEIVSSTTTTTETCDPTLTFYPLPITIDLPSPGGFHSPSALSTIQWRGELRSPFRMIISRNDGGWHWEIFLPPNYPEKKIRIPHTFLSFPEGSYTFTGIEYRGISRLSGKWIHFGWTGKGEGTTSLIRFPFTIRY